MIRARTLAAAALAAVSIATTIAPARAALDPDAAEADVRALRAKHGDAFCKKPVKPLPPRAIALCPLAKEIDGCEGFAAACAALEQQQPKPPPSWLVDLLRALGPVARVLIWTLVVVLAAVILVPLVRAILKRRRDRKVEDASPTPKAEQPTPEAPLEDALAVSDAELLLRKASEHEARGELDRAVFAYLGAAIRALDLRGAVRIARHRTHGEYVRSCTDDDARPRLREIVRAVDDVQFGKRAPSSETVAKVKARAIALVRGVPLALLVTALAVGCFGCGGLGGLASPYADPGGDEILIDLLKRQGAKVGRAGPLASIPLPGSPGPEGDDADGDDEPSVLVVDFARTPLDEETTDHLVRWVKRGGTLVAVSAPWSWPKAFAAKNAWATSPEITVTTWDGGEERTFEGQLAHPAVFRWDGGFPLARTKDEETHAAMRELGRGKVVGFASNDLFTNAGLATKGNAAAMIAILETLDAKEFRVARPEDGTAPPNNPFAALARAGLGLGLWHALIATILLFLAVGIRLVRATPTPPPRRRAFVEHVEATGALWARTGLAAHALAAYARWADERIRARMPRGAHDVPGFLAQRTGRDREACEEVWRRAQEARAPSPADERAPRGDEPVALKRLGELLGPESGARVFDDR